MLRKEERLGVGVNKENRIASWRHPGGKLRRCGADRLTDTELLATIIGSGTPGKRAVDIAGEILRKFYSFKGLANQPFEELSKIKGLKEVKITRIAAVFEIARRIVKQVK